jgi:hypothetical protein
MEINQKIIPPSRPTFWRLILFACGALAFGADWQAIGYARSLGIDFLSSKSWMLALTTLALAGSLCFLLLGLTLTSWRDRILSVLEIGQDVHLSRVQGVLLNLGFVAVYVIIDTNPKLISLLRGQDAFRSLVFLGFALAGAKLLKTYWRDASLALAFVTSFLLLATIHRILSFFSAISDYPFALGWSEATRYYLPSLFISKIVYGQRFSWPIINPSLHLLLIPPYLFHAPLWIHRAWLVLLKFLLVILVAPALLSRMGIRKAYVAWLAGLWVAIFLLQGPLYFHLALIVILVLCVFNPKKNLSTWLLIVVTSVWAGISRINWFPVPAMLVAVLYFLEVPYAGKKFLQYLIKPAAWFLVGNSVAFISQRVYIALSGVVNTSLFYTSLNSDLLWYRLWPNATYSVGILIGIALVSIPLWMTIGIVLYQRHSDWHFLRLGLLAAVLLVLFAGGIIVSLKIGGGANLHNLDAYTVCLLVIFAYLFFGRYVPEGNRAAKPVRFHWSVLVLLLIIPVWYALQPKLVFYSYDHAEAQATLAALQQRINQVNAQGGEILFITQRHLISMHMLKGAQLIPEYEREELMEMAMAQNKAYLLSFESDMRHHRFAAIVVDPLKFKYQDSSFTMGEENNAWVRYVVKPILCNYREDQAFPSDSIAIYVPQDGPGNCP